MHYTIRYALNCRDCDRIIDLAKNGMMYVVTLWNKVKHQTEKRTELAQLRDAENVFYDWCNKWGATVIKETEQTWDATDFD